MHASLPVTERNEKWFMESDRWLGEAGYAVFAAGSEAPAWLSRMCLNRRGQALNRSLQAAYCCPILIL